MGGLMVYSGISSMAYGAVVSGYDGTSAPEREYQFVSVPGRNGSLLLDSGHYKDVEASYELFFLDGRRAWEYRAALSGVLGYARLENTFEPGEYRMAYVKGPVQVEMAGGRERHARVRVTFGCKPQRFLASGDWPREFTATDPGALWNPCDVASEPLIRIYGTGEAGIGEGTVTVTAHGKEYVDVDSAVQDCYFGAENLNKFVTLSGNAFPLLQPGANGVRLGEGVQKIIVYPRWWKL